MADTTQTVTEETKETGKLGFGPGQINNPTPVWATWGFRIFLYAASLTIVIVTTDTAIPAKIALAIAKYLGYAVMAVHGISKMFGIDISKDEQEAKDSFK